jgi:hypothetical protein
MTKKTQDIGIHSTALYDMISADAKTKRMTALEHIFRYTELTAPARVGFGDRHNWLSAWLLVFDLNTFWNPYYYSGLRESPVSRLYRTALGETHRRGLKRWDNS